MEKYTYNPSLEERKAIFVASCIESAALRLGCDAEDMYKRMQKINLIRDYILPCFYTSKTCKALHDESTCLYLLADSCIVDDVIEELRK